MRVTARQWDGLSVKRELILHPLASESAAAFTKFELLLLCSYLSIPESSSDETITRLAMSEDKSFKFDVTSFQPNQEIPQTVDVNSKPTSSLHILGKTITSVLTLFNKGVEPNLKKIKRQD